MQTIAILCWAMLVGFAFIPPVISLAADIENDTSKTNIAKNDLEYGSLNELIEDRLQKIVRYWQQPKSSNANEKASRPPAISSENDSHGEETIMPNAVPVYMPPIRGAPVGRVAGGTRGILDEYPSDLCVISPDHTAMTIRRQPALYWFLREKTVHPVELTIIEEQAIDPLLETRIDRPLHAGIQKLQIADYGISLKQDVTYKWFISIVPDPNHRSKDTLAWGAVRYISISDDLVQKLSLLDKKASVDVYARAGIWYDAFACISDLIRSDPNDSTLVEMYRALLEEVGLSQILQ
jgi:hypothetical protein